MGLLPWNDWNGDGVVDWQDTAIESAMIQFQMDEMEREKRERNRPRNMHMVELIRAYGKSVLEYDDFRIICHKNGYFTEEFTQEDLDEIQRELMQI